MKPASNPKRFPVRGPVVVQCNWTTTAAHPTWTINPKNHTTTYTTSLDLTRTLERLVLYNHDVFVRMRFEDLPFNAEHG
jgi:hypothetical protein